ncbi:MAG: NAD(P)/FAD-dependent oxidoreductase [Myxococcota bacterium]|nr:NAD(P)/FAD-dependent oxidoreductase [Myxococcota bacterium]
MSQEAAVHAHGEKREPELDAVIVGAGFAGLYMLYRAREVLGIKVKAFETGEDVGGTWYWNRYPGARCDSESFYYCYTFSPEIQQEWDWSSKYPGQPEILRYLDFVADRLDLRKDIQFNTRVTNASFDEANNLWEVTTEAGDSLTARFLITAVGCLSSTNVPDLKGLENFEGRCVHTGQWPVEGVDFTGKRVAMIGTGSTGIQAAPVISAEADHLTVFQRTANFSIPARNAPLSSERRAEVKADYPAIVETLKSSNAGFPYEMSLRSALEASEEERNAVYESLWQEGGFAFFWGSFFDIMIDEKANDTAADFIRGKIRETVKDPEVAEMLIPRGYPFGTKRPPIDTDYFETFNRENVRLVDLKRDPLVEITPKGLRTEGEEFEFDILVLATGFDAMTGSLIRMGIHGVGGRSLGEKWEEGPKTYLGLQTAGFPNLFTITGPGSPSVLVNMPTAIEQHVEWISDCIEYMRAKGCRRIEAEVDAEERWVDQVNEAAAMTLFLKAQSWYVGANIPGKKRVFMPYPGGNIEYRQFCDESVAANYAGFDIRA